MASRGLGSFIIAGSLFLAASLAGSLFLAASLAACATTEPLGADGGADAQVEPPVESAPKRVFVTRRGYTADLRSEGGDPDPLIAADNLCQIAAEAALLEGKWRAWLSTSTQPAVDRIADVGPWYLLDGVTLVFNNKANIQTEPLASIRIDEQGNGVFDQTVWTGTVPGGRAAEGNLCDDWGTRESGKWGRLGRVSSFPAEWTSYSNYSCASAARLYCFEQ